MKEKQAMQLFHQGLSIMDKSTEKNRHAIMDKLAHY
jgi:hypothetical protein